MGGPLEATIFDDWPAALKRLLAVSEFLKLSPISSTGSHRLFCDELWCKRALFNLIFGSITVKHLLFECSGIIYLLLPQNVPLIKTINISGSDNLLNYWLRNCLLLSDDYTSSLLCRLFLANFCRFALLALLSYPSHPHLIELLSGRDRRRHGIVLGLRIGSSGGFGELTADAHALVDYS